MENKEWLKAHKQLLENIKKQAFTPDSDFLVTINKGPKKLFLPAYIPYIGPEYFQYKPRIICYAINQNLSKHTKWSEDWLTRWSSDIDLAFDRLNRAAQQGEPLPLKPYAEGFIPLVALIAIYRWIKKNGGFLPSIVDDVLAVTNYVKFSTVEDASSASIPLAWWRECGVRYVVEEIRVLVPDIIICFGLKTASELQRVLNLYQPLNYNPEVLTCRFPSRLPSIKNRPLSAKEFLIWNELISPLCKRIRKPKAFSYHKWKISQYPNYFIETAKSWNIFPNEEHG